MATYNGDNRACFKVCAYPSHLSKAFKNGHQVLVVFLNRDNKHYCASTYRRFSGWIPNPEACEGGHADFAHSVSCGSIVRMKGVEIAALLDAASLMQDWDADKAIEEDVGGRS
jgi:hypothetical protein